MISQFTLEYLGTTTITKEIDGRDRLRELMKQSYAQLEHLRVLARNVNIHLVSEGQIAVVEDDSILEITDKNGNAHLVTSLTKMRFTIIDEQIQLITLDSHSHLGARPLTEDNEETIQD